MKNLTLLLLLSLLVSIAIGCDSSEQEPDPSENIVVTILGTDGAGTIAKVAISGTLIYTFEGQSTTITLSDSTDQLFDIGEVNSVTMVVAKGGLGPEELKIELHDSENVLVSSGAADAPGSEISLSYQAANN